MTEHGGAANYVRPTAVKVAVRAHSRQQERIFLGVLALAIGLLLGIYPLLLNSAYGGSADLHAGLELGGALLGILAGIALIASGYVWEHYLQFLVGLAFFVGGVADLLQGLGTFRNLFGLPPSAVGQFISGMDLSRWFLAGSILLLTPFLCRQLQGKELRRTAPAIVLAATGASVALTLLALAVPWAKLANSDSPVPGPVVLALAIIPLAALAVFLWEYHRTRDPFAGWVALAIAIYFAGQVLLAFSRFPDDAFFEVAHLYKVLAPAALLLGFVLYQTQALATQRRNEAAWVQEHRLLRALMDYLPDAIYFKDRASRFIQTNRAHAKNWFHLDDPAEAIGKTDFDFFAEEHARQAFTDEQKIVETGQPLVDIEEKETWPDGTVTWVSTTKMPLYDEEGQIVGTFGITRDITDRKEMLRREQEQRQFLEKLVAQMRGSAQELRSAAAEILAAAIQQASGANEQSTALTQVATTVSEVRDTVEQTSLRAQAVAGLAREAAEASKSGAKVVAETVAGMGQIKQKVETIAHNILALSEQSQAVGQIIAAVDEIATQSNMLALNAAVEAARAGDFGKGFAVVASEVRTLAEQSRAATVRVREILSEIQRGVNTVVMATEEGMKGADAGVQLTGKTGDALKELTASALSSMQAAEQIAAAVEQQLAGMEQISQAMQGIHQVTAQNLAATRESEKAAEKLNQLAGQLYETASPSGT